MIDKLIDEMQVVVFSDGDWYLIVMSAEKYDVFQGQRNIGMYFEKSYSAVNTGRLDEIIRTNISYYPSKENIKIIDYYEKLGYSKEFDIQSLYDAIDDFAIEKIANQHFLTRYKNESHEIWSQYYDLYPNHIPSFIWWYLKNMEWIIENPECLPMAFNLLMLNDLPFFENEV